MLLCAAKMLNHVNLRFYGDMLRGAIDKVLKGGKVCLQVDYPYSSLEKLFSRLELQFPLFCQVRTKDLGGQSTTKEYTYAIINNLR